MNDINCSNVSNKTTDKNLNNRYLGKIDQYQIVRELDSDDFSRVCLAKDQKTKDLYVIRTLHPQLLSSTEAMEYLRGRLNNISKLSHRNISSSAFLHQVNEVTYNDDLFCRNVNINSGDFVIITNFTTGSTLLEWSEQFPNQVVPINLCTSICRQIASALDYAHSKKILHSDLNPSNIIVKKGCCGKATVKVINFGLLSEIKSAMLLVPEIKFEIGENNLYMSPERWQGKVQNASSDQYSLACIFYELVSGNVPLADVVKLKNQVAIMSALAKQEPNALKELNNSQNEIIGKALAKKPNERWSSCSEFMDKLLKTKKGGRFWFIGGLLISCGSALYIGYDYNKKDNNHINYTQITNNDFTDIKINNNLALVQNYIKEEDVNPEASEVENISEGADTSDILEEQIKRINDLKNDSKNQFASLNIKNKDGVFKEKYEVIEASLKKLEGYNKPEDLGIAEEAYSDFKRAIEWIENTIANEKIAKIRKSANDAYSAITLDKKEDAFLEKYNIINKSLKTINETNGYIQLETVEKSYADFSSAVKWVQENSPLRDQIDTMQKKAREEKSSLVLKWDDGVFKEKNKVITASLKTINENNDPTKFAIVKDAYTKFFEATNWIKQNTPIRDKLEEKKQELLGLSGNIEKASKNNSVNKQIKQEILNIETHILKGDFSSAQETFPEVFQKAKNELSLIYQKNAESLMEKNEWGKSLILLEKALEFNPQNNAALELKKEAKKNLLPHIIVKVSLDGSILDTNQVDIRLNDSSISSGKKIWLTEYSNQDGGEISASYIKGYKAYVGIYKIGLVNWSSLKEIVIKLEESPVVVCGIELVKLPNGKYFSKYEVTQEQWLKFMDDNPSYFSSKPNHPVENVSYGDCQKFIKKLNKHEDVKASNLTFRLPTYDEWKSAALAGHGGGYGTAINNLDDYAWYRNNSFQTHSVGSKKPNEWGLYDMHGNVCEWTSTEGETGYLCCGGSFFDTYNNCNVNIPRCYDEKSRILGFRLIAE